MWEGMISRLFVLRSLKGRCHGNQFWGQIFTKLAYPTFIRCIGVPERIGGSHSDFRRLNANALYTFDRNIFVRFSPVTPEFTTLECVQQASIRTRVRSRTVR